MRFRFWRAAASFALVCGFTLVSPFSMAFAKDGEYRKISLDKWVQENCTVVIENNDVKNTPFYLEYREHPDRVLWTIGSYRNNLKNRASGDLTNEIDKDLITPSSKTGNCIRIPGKIAPAPTSDNDENYSSTPLTRAVYTGIFQAGKKSNLNGFDSTKFQIDWKVNAVDVPAGIIQKDIEIGKPPPNSGSYIIPSELKYQTIVANTLLAENMPVNSERAIYFRFKSSGIYHLKVDAEIKYNGGKHNSLSNIYTIVIGDEVSFKNQEPDPEIDDDKTDIKEDDKKKDDNKRKINPPKNPSNDTSNDPSQTNPQIPSLLPNQSGVDSQKQNIAPSPSENKADEANKSEEKTPVDSKKTNGPINSSNKSSKHSSASSKSDRTAAQEAGLRFLKTAPLIVAGTVVLIGAGAAVTIFTKIKP